MNFPIIYNRTPRNFEYLRRSIYHDRERVSSRMTISSFYFSDTRVNINSGDTQNFIKHRRTGERVLSAVLHLRYRMSSNFTVKGVWIFFALVFPWVC